ncbi:MAG: tRNA guanosine(34) transglycosylase Tgt [Candidatus Pacebacteria bacterium]|nr:tRNA guanosine(34) transglycosylase Tgt [Candidatus Paceibacterota bacterium]
MEFKILKKSKKSRARFGILKTKNGILKTPCFVPVATKAAVKALTLKEMEETKSQIFIANAFHLHLKPGEDVIKKAGGIHNFANWKKPTMTDSGGFQVFSLGFGRDFNVGKISKNRGKETIEDGKQPNFVKITEEGAFFKSPFDGRELFLGPKESMMIQEKIGADIIFAFDECTAPFSDFNYVKKAIERTNKWAKICLKVKKTDQALFGVVQGSKFKELREKSASFISSLGFDGFGIGGDLGESKKTTEDILKWTIPILPEKKPRHLLGIGKIEDILLMVKNGIDFFDCTVPTHYGRRGIAFISADSFLKEKKIDLRQSKFLKDKNPLDKKCSCFVCLNHRRNYISHLIRAKEISGLSLLTFHNLYFFNSYVEKIREKIKEGKI